jgi:hypothetical protein
MMGIHLFDRLMDATSLSLIQRPQQQTDTYSAACVA